MLASQTSMPNNFTVQAQPLRGKMVNNINVYAPTIFNLTLSLLKVTLADILLLLSNTRLVDENPLRGEMVKH